METTTTAQIKVLATLAIGMTVRSSLTTIALLDRGFIRLDAAGRHRITQAGDIWLSEQNHRS